MLLSTVLSIPSSPCWLCGGTWTLAGGGDLLIANVLQAAVSVPWCTAVLTDRLFVAPPRRAFIGVLGGILMAALFSMCASFIGIYARFSSEAGQPGAGGVASEGFPTFREPAEMARGMGEAYYHLFVFMTMLSSMGSIDATLCAAGKLGGLEIFGLLAEPPRTGGVVHPHTPGDAGVSGTNLVTARIATLALAAVGLSTLSFEDIYPGSLSLASITGIMAIGLGAPMFLLPFWGRGWKRSPLCLILSVVVGLIVGIVDKQHSLCAASQGHRCLEWTRAFTPSWGIGDGPGRIELGLSIFGFLLSVVGALVGFMLDQQFRIPDEPLGEVNVVLFELERRPIPDHKLEASGSPKAQGALSDPVQAAGSFTPRFLPSGLPPQGTRLRTGRTPG